MQLGGTHRCARVRIGIPEAAAPCGFSIIAVGDVELRLHGYLASLLRKWNTPSEPFSELIIGTSPGSLSQCLEHVRDIIRFLANAPPWAQDALYYGFKMAITTFLSDADMGRETLLTPMCMEARGQTCRTRTRDGRCTRET